MSLTFGATTADYVGFGNPGTVTEATIVVFGGWYMPTTLTNSRALCSKNALDGNGGPAMTLSGTGGDVLCRMSLSSVNRSSISNTAPLVLNEWRCLIGINDPGDSQIRMYAGSRTASLAEVGYSSTTAGSGTSSTGNSLRWGNTANASPVLAFQGGIANVFYLTGRVPTLGELIDWQFRTRPISGALLRCSLGFNGTGTQADWSGNVNNGTLSGTVTQGAHVPLGPPFGYEARLPYRVVASAARYSPVMSILAGVGNV